MTMIVQLSLLNKVTPYHTIPLNKDKFNDTLRQVMWICRTNLKTQRRSLSPYAFVKCEQAIWTQDTHGIRRHVLHACHIQCERRTTFPLVLFYILSTRRRLERGKYACLARTQLARHLTNSCDSKPYY